MLIISFSQHLDFLTGGNYEFTLDHYISIISSESLHIIDYLKNSLTVASVTSFFVLLVASLSAYAITRISFPGRRLIPLLTLGISIFPQISIIGYLYKWAGKLGLINTYFALILPYLAWTLPLAFWILISYFSQIPQELDKAALIDGADRKKILWRIVLPLATPGLLSCFLLVFIACFNEFLFALMLTSDYRAQTISVGISLFQGLHGEIPWGELMAASFFVTSPLIILTLIFQRFIVEGLTRGAIKG
ncbi:MAG: carbohydrate ABC transporter permease [Candidatus Desulfofervidaceae bacterium]|nr:carbohydrate ABC transporter permease [Candidatus Desulfofervidaceae bacterium]